MNIRALSHRNYRLFFIGQGCSLIGSWAQQTAMSWLVYRVTGSSALLGLTVFLAQAPVFFLAPFADRLAALVSRQKLMMVVQVTALLQALTLTILSYGGWTPTWSLLLASIVAGCIAGVEGPLRQALLGYLVDDAADLQNAVVLNSLNINCARLIGPVIAGTLIVHTSEAFCFLINAASFLAVLFAFTKMKLATSGKAAARPKSLGEAFKYVKSKPRIRIALLLLFLIGGFFTPYFVVLPIYAKTIFGGDSGTLGALMAAAAVGSLFGTLTLLVQEDLDLTSATLFATAVAGVAVAVFAFNTTLWLAYVLLVIIGYGLILSAAALNVILQTVSAPRFRTRVMQFYAMAYSGVVPFSGLAIGALSHRIGTERALFWFAVSGLTGTACLAGSLPVVRRRARPLRRWVLSPFFSR